MNLVRRFVLPTCLALLAGSVSAAVTATVGDPPAARADALDDSLKELKELSKSDPSKAMAKVTELENNLDSRVTDVFADIAKSTKDDRLAKTVMKIAAQRKHEGLFKYVLKPKVGDKKMPEEHPDRYLAILDSIAYYGDAAKPCRKDLEDVYRKALGKPEPDVEVAKRAVAAFAAVREGAVIEELIKWLKDCESTGGGQGGGGGGGSVSEARKKANGAVKPTIEKCLQTLTAMEFPDGNSWAKWWKENERGWKPPEAEDVSEPDWATIAEYMDRAWGYTLKKPEKPDAKWAFEKNDEANLRVRLLYRDDKGVLWARCNVYALATWNDVANLEQFCKYFEKSFREGAPPDGKPDFSEFTHEPSTKELKIGGKDFMLLTARGLGANRWASWAACERRIYVTMINNKFLYFECAVLSGWEDEYKNSLWSTIEGMPFKK